MKLFKNNKGFTILEVAISLGLIVVVFGGVTSLAIMTRESEQTSKNNMIAAYLAKEAQELVRFQRDKNYIGGASAFSGISNYVPGNDYGFLIDYAGNNIPVKYNDVTTVDPLSILKGFYNNAGEGEVTIFRRLVITTYHDAEKPLPAYIDVKVEVSWKGDSKKNTYTLTSQLTDWK